MRKKGEPEAEDTEEWMELKSSPGKKREKWQNADSRGGKKKSLLLKTSSFFPVWCVQLVASEARRVFFYF